MVELLFFNARQNWHPASTVPPFYTEVARLYDFGAPAPEVRPSHSRSRSCEKRIFRCSYIGPMVNFFVETYYDLEILSSNMDFAVIYRRLTYYQTLNFIFCNSTFGEKVLRLTKCQQTFALKNNTYFQNQIDHACSNKLLFVLIRDKMTNHQTTKAESADPHDRDLATRAPAAPIGAPSSKMF